MTQEEKLLLIKELCARLPFGVKVNFRGFIEVLHEAHIYESVQTIVGEKGILYDIDMPMVMPLLRPMSSMTLEEHGQYMDFILWSYNDYDATTTTCVNKERINEYKDFIYSHHLDDCDLIGKGLALEAPEGEYNK